MKHASKYLNAWTVNLWSKIPLLASLPGYRDNSTVWNAALSRHTYACKCIYKIICNRTFLGGLKHASKYFNDWTVNFWSKIPLLASRPRYRDNSIVWNAALSRHTYACKCIYQIICNRTFLGGMTHASKYFNVGRKFLVENSASSFTPRYRDNSIVWNAALSRHTQACKDK